MNWGLLGTTVTVVVLVASFVRGPSWYRRWLLTSLGAVVVAGGIGLGVVLLLADDDASGGDRGRVATDVDHVAVFHVDRLPEPDRMAFIEAAGLDVFEEAASCWVGLAELLGVPPDRYVLGVWAPSDDELADAVARVPGQAVLTAALVRVCPTD